MLNDVVGLTYLPGFTFRTPLPIQRLGPPRRLEPTLASVLSSAIVSGRYYWRTHDDGEF